MKKATIIIFVLLLACGTLLSLFLPQKSFSEWENRTLMTRDKISHNIKDGSFQKDYQSYLADQFPFRNGLVSAQTAIRRALGQSDIGGAYICKSNRLVQKITPTDVKESAVISYAGMINSIAKSRPVYVMYVPSAGVALKDEVPAGAPMYDYNALYSALTEKLDNAKCINLIEALGSGEYYYKTDHHWNALGAYKGYAAFCEMKGEAPKSYDSFGARSVCSDFRGTLASKVPATKEKDEILLPAIPEGIKVTADGMPIEFYDTGALETKDKYNVFQGGNHGIVDITTQNENGKTLLILKDSFANSFVPYVLGDYSRVILVDERYMFISITDYVSSLNPDEVLVLREIIN